MEERDSISPPPLPPPDFDESPASLSLITDFTNPAPIINGTLSAPSDADNITVQPSIDLTLPLKINFLKNAAQQQKSERLVEFRYLTKYILRWPDMNRFCSNFCVIFVLLELNAPAALKQYTKHGLLDTSQDNV